MSTETSSIQQSQFCARPSPKSLKTLPDILHSLSLLEQEEAEVASSLASLIASEEPIVDAVNKIRRQDEPIAALQQDAISLSERVSVTARTAERVGKKVRTLDEEMKRIREAIDRVNQVIELRNSLISLHSSMDEQDWESASRHCARAMALPIEVISGPFAESTVPTSDLPLPPVQTLQTARERLLDIFLKHFRQASKARDATATSRFFKLFPSIGWEKEGLDAYVSFVLELVHTKPPSSAKPSSPMYYTAYLTALFESICNIINQHQAIVEKYYGDGKMLYVVERLMTTCDDVVGKILEEWEESRSTILKSPLRKAHQANALDDDAIDAREVDKVLTELSAMIMRYTAFRRFLYNNFEEILNADKMEDQVNSDAQANHTTDQKQLVGLKLFEESVSAGLFSRLCTSYYITLETWYLKTTIAQAHRSSTLELTQVPPCSTVPDLIFYLLKMVLYRMLNTGSRAAVGNLIPRVKEVMDQDYIMVIKRKLDDVYRQPVNPTSGLKAEKAERENRLNFIVLLNDIDISTAHMERLVKQISSSNSLSQSYLEQEAQDVQYNIGSLRALAPKFASTLKNGIDQLFTQLIRPRLRTFIPEVYKDVSYFLDDEAYTASQSQDIVRKRFCHNWDSIIDGYKESFTESNYRLLFSLALDVITRAWEKLILTTKFTDLGAIRFDRDLRAILSYLSSQTALAPAREKLQRLQHISLLLNLDKEEDVDEFYSGSGISWKLSIAEAHSVIALKHDSL